MKKRITLMLSLLVMGVYGAFCAQTALGSELLDVRAFFLDATLSVEITANMPMIYMYGSMPGQAGFVVDIANVNPEKVEPLIVVNKGPVAKISVARVQVSGVMVSRIAFSLTSEAEAKVIASPDRKKLLVTFKNGPGTSPIIGRKPMAVSSVADSASLYSHTADSPPPAKIKDQPLVKTAVVTEQKNAPLQTPTVSKLKENSPQPTVMPDPVTMAPVSRKPEPPLPLTTAAIPIIRDITTGAGFIDVQAAGPIQGFRTMELKQPSRLAIDIKGAKVIMTAKVIMINRFGVSKVRVGINPGFVRIVLDSAKSVLPKYSIVTTDNGLRINLN